MFFENYYVTYSPDLMINSISSYRNIMDKFIFKFLSIKKNSYNDNYELYSDALIYSKYYLYWKTIGCIYNQEIMNLLYDIEFL